MWSIRVLTGVNAGETFDLQSGKNTIGRGGVSQLKISSLGISKEHCEVHVYKDKIILIDLKSSNGTYLNGVRIQNAILKLGDKISLFDVILDVIPKAVEVSIDRKLNSKVEHSSHQQQAVLSKKPNHISHHSILQPQVETYSQSQSAILNGNAAIQMNNNSLNSMNIQNSAQNFISDNQQNNLLNKPEQLSFGQKVENYIENGLMPLIYKLSAILPFKQVLLSFVVIFVFAMSFLSLIPLTTIMQESNLIEAGKRAKSIARTLAKANEAALMSGQYQNLSVTDVKEDGIKEALIIQQSDGAIIAPVEKAGREQSKAFIGRARKENRATYEQLDDKTVAASYPIGVYDPTSGSTQVKYLAIVYYNVASLSVSQDRIIGLLVQVLVIGSIIGSILFFLFSRLISFPLIQINKQIDQAFRDKTDQTEVLFDDPHVQKLVANVNLMLNRMWNGFSDGETQKAQQNKDLEFHHLVDSLNQPVVVINSDGNIVALNNNFAQLVQSDQQQLIQTSYSQLPDQSLVANIQNLIERAQNNLFDKQSDRIPFSQFECEIHLTNLLNTDGQPEFYFISFTKISEQ